MNRMLVLLFSVAFVACDDDAGSGPVADGTTTSAATSSASTGDVVDDPMPPRADLGVQPPDACAAACDVASACQGVAVTDCLLQCTGELQAAAEVGESCATERTALETCLGTLSCDELNAHDVGGDSPCRTLDQQASVACADPSGEPATVCTDFCDAVEACGLSDQAACVAACVETRSSAAESGPNCATAQDQQFTCVAALDCAELETWVSTGDSTCPDDLDQACSGD